MLHYEEPNGRRLDPGLITTRGSWENVFQGEAKAALERALPAYVAPRRWFGSKASTIDAVEIADAIPFAQIAYLVLLHISYAEDEPEGYLLPLAFAAGDRAEDLRRVHPAALVADLQTSDGAGVIYDAVFDVDFCHAVLDAIGRSERYQGAAGDLLASVTSVFSDLRGNGTELLRPALLGVEQSNTSIRYGDRLILKLFRRLEAGTNPDLEIGHFLTERTAFTHVPPVAGALEYRHRQAQEAEPVTLAILQGFVPNQGDAWRHTLDDLRHYFERVLSLQPATIAVPRQALSALLAEGIPAQARDLIGPYLDSARLLGRRTAELHLALASDPADPAFVPEPFTAAYQRSLVQEMGDLTVRVMQLLRRRLAGLPPAIHPEAEAVLALEPAIAARSQALLQRQITALRTRIHGDYHLGQVLYTGSDFVIIDFEGEPARPLRERRQKRSPLQDVAGMLRSFHYAAYAAYFDQVTQGLVQPDAAGMAETWIRFWHRWTALAFVQAYLDVAHSAAYLPGTVEELQLLLDAFLLEKAVYELGYELNSRPDWLKIPLQGILQTLQGSVGDP